MGVLWPLAAVAGIIVLVLGNGQVPTEEGRAATAHWLGVRRFLAEQDNLDDLPPAAVAVWDRYLAYGAALGESPAAVHGLGDEVRTRMSLSDWNHLSRLVRDPAARAAALRRATEERLVRLYGAGGAGAVLGPDDGDFWSLVERTARGWGPAMAVVTYDPPAWAAAVGRRLAALRAVAPAEVAGAIDELAPTVQQVADAVGGRGRVGRPRPGHRRRRPHLRPAGRCGSPAPGRGRRPLRVPARARGPGPPAGPVHRPTSAGLRPPCRAPTAALRGRWPGGRRRRAA